MNIVPPDDRAAFAVWITGLPASGKSTVTGALARKLGERGVRFAVLESDALRKTFSDGGAGGAYGEQDRDYFYGSLAFIGQVLVEQGICVIFDATANRRSYRDRARQRISRFAEVFVDSPLEVCMRRDPKGIYRKAREGEAANVPGLQVGYEPPERPDVVIRGDRENPEEAAGRIMDLLSNRHFL
jgi:adenylylsulfate kinase